MLVCSAKRKRGKGWLVHMLASFMMSLTQTARHKMAALRALFQLYYQAKVFYKFQTLIFNEQDEKSRENDCA